MDTLASIALCSEPPRPGILKSPPKHRDENILTRSMIVTIVSTAAFFVVVMLALLVGMKNSDWFAGPGPKIASHLPFTLRQVSIYFSVYVFFQIWNEINCRSLIPSVSGLTGLFKNRVFLAVVGAVGLMQVLIVTWGGRVFSVEPLGVVDWFIIAISTSSVLAMAEVVRLARLKSANAQTNS
jgi:Ca2+-transporting ATPase